MTISSVSSLYWYCTLAVSSVRFGCGRLLFCCMRRIKGFTNGMVDCEKDREVKNRVIFGPKAPMA